MYSRVARWMLLLFVGWLASVGASCAVTTSVPPSTPPPESTSPEEEAVPSAEEPSPRALASLQLTEQGRMLLEAGHPDDAIRVLERAVGLNPTNGGNYYYLSEAWLMKGDMTRAEEFNDLAGLYLRGDEWKAKLMEQRERIIKGRR
jgi:predicted Zn-dependent protease